MSLVIAQRLRALSRQATQIAAHASNLDDEPALAEIARELLQIAEKIERDAKD